MSPPMYWSAKFSHGWNQGRHEQNTQYTLQTLDYALVGWDRLILPKWHHQTIAKHHKHHFQATQAIISLRPPLQIIQIIPSTHPTLLGVMRPSVFWYMETPRTKMIATDVTSDLLVSNIFPQSRQGEIWAKQVTYPLRPWIMLWHARTVWSCWFNTVTQQLSITNTAFKPLKWSVQCKLPFK